MKRTASDRRSGSTWPMRPAISARGRHAVAVVSVAFLSAGALFLWGSWDELTCPYSAERCNYWVGYGGLVSLLALATVIVGVAVLLTARRRPVSAEGSDGWVYAEALLVVGGAAVLALAIPGRVCPQGSELARGFAICIDLADPARRVDPTSQLTLKWLVLVAGLVLAIPVWRQRRLPWPIPAMIAFAAWGTGFWVLFSRTVLPKVYVP